jgi:glycosyltransferase involved in cell wall biosynthesis
MGESKRLSVVIPAFNEARQIGRVLRTMPDFVDQVVVVDDASDDHTDDVARQVELPGGSELVVIRHERNQGVGAAIRTGYLRALEGGAEVIAVMAGDGQMDPADLARVVAPITEGRADYAKGDRLDGGTRPTRMPLERYLGTLLLTRLTRLATGYQRLCDSQSGFTAISASCLRALPLARLHPGYGYPNHLLILLGEAGMEVVDVPIRAIYGQGEVSGIRYWRVAPRLMLLLGRGILDRWRRHPHGLLEPLRRKHSQAPLSAI